MVLVYGLTVNIYDLTIDECNVGMVMVMNVRYAAGVIQGLLLGKTDMIYI